MLTNQPLQNQSRPASPTETQSPSDKSSSRSVGQGLAQSRNSENHESENAVTFDDVLRHSSQPEQQEDSSELVIGNQDETELNSPRSSKDKRNEPEDVGPIVPFLQLDDPLVASPATSELDVEFELFAGLGATNLPNTLEPIAVEISRRQAQSESKSVDEGLFSSREETGSLEPSRRLSTENLIFGSSQLAESNGWQQLTLETATLETPPSGIMETSTFGQQSTDSSSGLVSQAFARTAAAINPDAAVSATGSAPVSAPTTGVVADPLLGNARTISNQVSDSMVREISNGTTEGTKRMTLYLHPAELGKLTIQVGWDNETVSAAIVTSEMAISELLNRDRNWLINSLEASGFDLTSFDVSHGGSDVQRQFDEQFDQASNSPSSSSGKQTDADETPAIETTIVDATDGKGTVVNIVV